ncbi:MAG: hypothetical protein QG652_1291 [Pseudomonadota bacterium]|nr:hypothetical protein [Pseudomonadota bacterium]
MNMQEIREIARVRGIKTSRLSKESIIRQIQRMEGNFDCFATAVDRQCNQTGCLWREDCFALAGRKHSS